MSGEGPIIVFDGLCVLCSGWARFVLQHDRREHFRLAAMQRPAGAALAARFGVDPDDPETIIVVCGDDALRDSDAVIHILTQLGWPWRAAVIARGVPKLLRDRVYRIVARHRYRLFGRRETCWLPDSAQASRIL